MRESYWGYWIILLGIFVIVIMMLISNVTTTNTQDYYIIKEVTEQSMVDAVDLGYYRVSGEVKINADKFVESFLRRFSENVALSTYEISFYGIYESPPKVSVKVTTKSATYNIGASSDSFDIVNKIDAVLELNGVALGTEPDGNFDIPSGGTGGGSSGATSISVNSLNSIINRKKDCFYTYNSSTNTWVKKSKSDFLQEALDQFEAVNGELSETDVENIEKYVNQVYASVKDSYQDSDFDYEDGNDYDDDDDDFYPTMNQLDRIFKNHKEDFYDENYVPDDDEGYTLYTLRDYDYFVEIATDYFYEIKNDDLNKFEEAVVEDLVSQYYPTCPKSYKVKDE